mmetsp:Transcript_21147/g.49570  ORF Transcript_21147/g.49570 Transcript_21147/m.49570 type:complete len:207 (+) Transcript_21147:588-1208(+)
MSKPGVRRAGASPIEYDHALPPSKEMVPLVEGRPLSRCALGVAVDGCELRRASTAARSFFKRSVCRCSKATRLRSRRSLRGDLPIERLGRAGAAGSRCGVDGLVLLVSLLMASSSSLLVLPKRSPPGGGGGKCSVAAAGPLGADTTDLGIEGWAGVPGGEEPRAVRRPLRNAAPDVLDRSTLLGRPGARVVSTELVTALIWSSKEW